jgi:hypothetical protein
MTIETDAATAAPPLIADVIAELLEAKGWTASDLRTALHSHGRPLSRQAIHRWTTGERCPGRAVSMTLVEVFGLDDRGALCLFAAETTARSRSGR